MAAAGCYRWGMSQTVPVPAGIVQQFFFSLPFVTYSMAFSRTEGWKIH
jgi:hypothetical protein